MERKNEDFFVELPGLSRHTVRYGKRTQYLAPTCKISDSNSFLWSLSLLEFQPAQEDLSIKGPGQETLIDGRLYDLDLVAEHHFLQWKQTWARKETS